MKWNSRGPHGQLLRSKMAAGEIPWEGGNTISDMDIKQVYDGFTEFNKNYTKKQFYPAYRRCAKIYKDHVEKEGGRRRGAVWNNLEREDSSREVNLATTNQGNGGIVQADKPNNIPTGGLRPYKGRYSLLVFVYMYTCTTNLITIIYTYEFK